MTPRALVNASNPQRPWYLPIPELPTPPNGSSGTSGWIVQSLIAASPDPVRSRMRPVVHPRDDCLDRLDLEDRQDRAEHFVLHDRRVRRHIHQHGRRDVALASVGLAADG